MFSLCRPCRYRRFTTYRFLEQHVAVCIVVYRTYRFVEQIALHNISLLNRRIEQY